VFQSTPILHSISRTKRLTAMKAIATVLILNPFFVQAEQENTLQKIQRIAESNAMELGSTVADAHWTRIEFSKAYVDPVVVVEGSIANGGSSYAVGIRNVDAMGFEINLKNCNNSTETPLQETIAYSVIDNSQMTSTEQAGSAIRQPFVWGECATSTSS
jgi:hypothetical protein